MAISPRSRYDSRRRKHDEEASDYGGSVGCALTLAAPALAQEESALATGRLERQGITTYQYGVHIVSDEVSGAVYALGSDVMELDTSIGQRVTIYSTPAPGYESGQVEGGPPLVVGYRGRTGAVL